MLELKVCSNVGVISNVVLCDNFVNNGYCFLFEFDLGEVMLVELWVELIL